MSVCSGATIHRRPRTDESILFERYTLQKYVFNILPQIPQHIYIYPNGLISEIQYNMTRSESKMGATKILLCQGLHVIDLLTEAIELPTFLRTTSTLSLFIRVNK